MHFHEDSLRLWLSPASAGLSADQADVKACKARQWAPRLQAQARREPDYTAAMPSAHRHLLLESLAAIVLVLLLLILAAMQYRWIERLAMHERESRERLMQNAAIGLQGEIDARLQTLLTELRGMADGAMDFSVEQQFAGSGLVPTLYFVVRKPGKNAGSVWRLTSGRPGRFVEAGWSDLLQSVGPLGVELAQRGFGASLVLEGRSAALVLHGSAQLPGESRPTAGFLLAPVAHAALVDLLRRLARERVEPALGERLHADLQSGSGDAGLVLFGSATFDKQPLAGYFRLALRQGEDSAAAVTKSLRWRNLGVAFGILLLLAASSALLWHTARRARALAAQRLQMVAAVSHEMRTPLAVIHSAAANLADGVVAAPQRARAYGAQIRRESQRLQRLVENALQLGGIAQGRGESVQHSRLAEVLPELLERHFPGEPGIERDSATAELLQLRVALSPPDFQLVLGNLLDNAQRYRDAGTRVRLGLRRHTGWLDLVLANRSRGLAEGEESQVFDAFFRGAQARQCNDQGSGLGLSLVQSIVVRQGGRIGCRRVGNEILFELRLPLAPGASQ
jgi:signal transduction histidine kinase